MAKKKPAKKAPVKKAAKRGGPKSKPDTEEPEYSSEGMTTDEAMQFQEFLEMIADRLQQQSLDDEQLADELSNVKQELQDELDAWAGRIGEELGIEIESISDWMSGGGASKLQQAAKKNK